MNALIQASPRLTTYVSDGNTQLFSIMHEWRQLHEQCPGATPFQRPEWILAWIEAFSPHNLSVVQVRDRGYLVGVAPLLIYPRNKERVLAFAGGGVSDYLGHLSQQGREAEVIDALLSGVRDLPNWTVLELTDLPANSPLLKSEFLRSHIQEHDSCSVLSLPGSGEELLNIFSNRQRANLRMARSRLQRAGGYKVELATVETAHEFLEDLFRLHTARWSQSGEAGMLTGGVLKDERTRAFHNLCAPPLVAQGVLKLHRLVVGEHTTAIIYSLWERGIAYCYLQGFDPEYSFLSPGTYLMYEVIRDAVNHEMRRFDFLRGQERYKLHWRAEPEHTFRIVLTRADLLCALD